MDIWQVVLIIAGAGVIADQIWTKVVLRLWRLMRGTVQHIEADKILMEIAFQFKPNNGSSLVDRITHIDERLSAHSNRIEELTNKIDVFILDRHPGGNRHTDPPL
jgi:hypothetical protein